MHLDRNGQGDWIIDPEQLASRLDIIPGHLRHKMRLGLVTSRVEAGQHEDAGNWRVTVRTGQKAWQGIFDAAGNLTSERML
ncbi:DUF6522 family protein [Methylobacterium nigriterrae]|uniref:DUF6522 family protein n=1 Tax=Methylobacterium nigriterrae TaxID=3127512 RepID=UPI003013393C